MFSHLLNKPGSSNCFTSDFDGSVGDPPDTDLFTQTELDGGLGALDGSGSLTYNSKDQGTHGDWYSRWRYNTTVGALDGDLWDVELSWSTSYFYSTAGPNWIAFLAFSKSATSISNTNNLGVFGVSNLYVSPNFSLLRFYYTGILGRPVIIGDTIATSTGAYSGKIRLKYLRVGAGITEIYMYHKIDGVDTEWQLMASTDMPVANTHYLHYGFATGSVVNNPDIRGHTSKITRIHTLESVNVDCP